MNQDKSKCVRCGRRLYPANIRRGSRTCIPCRGWSTCRNCYTRYRGPDCPACAVHGPLELANHSLRGERQAERTPGQLEALAERAAARLPLFTEPPHA